MRDVFVRGGVVVADNGDLQSAFAVQVLQKLLRRIAVLNADGARAGRHDFPVLYAWTEGPVLFVVHRASASEFLWGLARDTRQSLIDPGPWNPADDAAQYYYLLDFEEGWAGPLSPTPEEDLAVIRWRGDQLEGLPERVSGIPDAYRYEPAQLPVDVTRRRDVSPSAEPRRYADPR